MKRLAEIGHADVTIFGHTHRRYSKEVEGITFVNVGSAGKPKDGDPRACYALVEVRDGKVSVTFRRVPYDVAAVASAIRNSGLPAHFAEQLEQA